MNITLMFIRIFFAIISIFFMTTYMVAHPEGSLFVNLVIGVIVGIVFIGLLVGFDNLFKKFNLRSFNIVIVGLLIGYLMAQALVLIFDAILDMSHLSVNLAHQSIEIIKIAIFLFGTYLGTIMTMRSADELYVSIPFVKFAPSAQKKKDILVDVSVLTDARVIDLCATGLLDNQLIIPRFVIKELYAQVEMGDEMEKSKAKRALDVLKKLEGVPNLELHFNDTDFPDVKDSTGKLVRLARLIDANILTADISRVQMASIEGVRVINLHSLSNALKPLMQAGEFIKIKIQRYGKEPRQGVGYLEDGTMVVVNGGGNFIGDTIDAQVLSVKHTSSGRMIFCNALEDEEARGNHKGSHDEDEDYYYEDEDEHH